MSDADDGANGNYDDFMMSGDEDVDVLEMEDETDEEAEVQLTEPSQTGESSEVAGVLDEQNVKDMCEAALAFMEDQNFQRSRELLLDVLRSTETHAAEPAALVWRWRSLVQIARSWLSEIHYNGIDDTTFVGTVSAFQALVGPLDRVQALNGKLVEETLVQLVQELFPPSRRDFLFAVELIADDSVAWKMHLRLQCIDILHKSLRFGQDPWMHELNGTLELKSITAKVWRNCLDNKRIDLRDIEKIQDYCCETDIQDAMNDLEYTDKIGLVLQCHIFNYLSGRGHLPTDVLSKLVIKLEQFSSNSLSVSQQLGLMILLSTARALVMLPAFSDKGNRIERPAFYMSVQALREQFWSCLQHMEEIGGCRQNFSSLFERFILSGFIFCSMILHRTDLDEINPFDLQQLKIALEVPSVQLLRTVYQRFLELDLGKLYEAIQRLSEVKGLLKGLIDNIYYLAQLAKLWEQIAPVYTCISLKDIQHILEIDSSIRVSRDDLLTVLMTSILNNSAKVYYKLDLTRDLVYFGDEYRVRLCSHPKQSFVKQKVFAASGVKLAHLEIANNIGIFDEPCSLKGLDSCAFFDKIQRSRDHIQEHNHHVSGIRYSDKYEELAGLANEVLTFSDLK